jgi:hypothetical protein
MIEQPRDWDKELADIDRVIEKQGPTAPGGAAPALPPGGTTSPAPRVPAPAEPAVARGSVAMTWFWMALAVLLAAALPLWPYGKGCGLQLFFYLGAAALALLAGAAGAIHGWRSRRGLPHVVSLLVVAFAGVMAAREVLPRIGYAAVSETWLCPSVPEPAPPPSTAPSPNGA